MNGFVNIVNGFSQSEIDALVVEADDLYTSGVTPPQDWTPKPNPSSPIDITSQSVMDGYSETALVGDGVADDSARLTAIGTNLSITNWYIPTGKTVLIAEVTPPEHVTHIFGGGTLKRKITGQTYQGGIFDIYYTVVIDGMTTINGTGDWQGHASMGQFILRDDNPDWNEWSSDGIEIRNCTFNTGDIYSDAISCFTGYDKSGNGSDPWKNGLNKHKNFKIYNNVFNANSHFAMEIGDRPVPSTNEQNGYLGLEIFNNEFVDGNAISLDKIRANSGAKVYNNRFTNCKWGLELATTDGVDAHHNEMTGITRHCFVVNSVKAVSDTAYALYTGTNFIHHNQIDDVNGDELRFVNLYYGNKDEYYENFFNTRFKVEYVGADAYLPADGPNVHDNTFVEQDSSWIVQFIDTISGIITNNEIYADRPTGTTGINLSNSSAVAESSNDIYLGGGGTCVNGEAQTGGICDLSYTGSVPTGRAGAGLSDAGAIGIGNGPDQ